MKTRLSGVTTAITAMIVFSMTGICFAQANQGAGAKPASISPSPTGPKKINVAVINLKSSSGVSAGEADLISDRLRGELFNTGKVNVMERDQMQEILKEQGFQQSGACSNEACMVEMGQLLGVEHLVTGSLGKVGSMFLVNLRIIDVKTAKITKVVSKDVKGSIEDVVGELRPIAVELVGSSGALAAPAVVEKKDADKSAEKPAEPEPVAEPQKVEKNEEPVPDERAEKNKNRAGIRMALNIYPGSLTSKVHVTYFDIYGIQQDSKTFPAFDSGYTSSAFINPQLKFIIKAGPVITIDVGPSYTYGSVEMKEADFQLGSYLNVFGVGVGVNFVKRWYPVKMNIGLMLDLNYLINMEEWKWDPMYYSGASDSVAFRNSFNASYGLRTGMEIMAGKHVGFNLDFVFRYSYFETMKETYDFADYSYNEFYYSYLLPMIGFGFGVNFYY